MAVALDAPRRAGARSVAGAGAILAEGAGLLLAVPLWLWWALAGGGFAAVRWLPGLAALAACGALLCALLPRPPLRGARAWALGGAAALSAWSGISLLWAGDRGAAWLGAERTALYAGALALPLLWPPSARVLRGALAAFVACALVAAGAALAGLADAGALIDGRLANPGGYPNAAAALLLMAAFPALLLGSAPRPAGGALRAVAPRALALGAGGALAATAVLAQSRGSVAVAAVGAVALLALAPSRGRALAALALLGAGLLAGSGPLLDVRRAALDGDVRAALGPAVETIAMVAVWVAAAAPAGDWLAARVRMPGALVRHRRRIAAAAAVALLAGGAAAFVAREGDPVSWASARVSDFRTPDYRRVESGGNRFEAGLGSNRADYWRVAIDVTRARPLTGTGAETFAAAYLERRRSAQTPRWAHSLWLGTAAEVGLPGLAALLAALGALAAALVAAWRRAGPARRPVLAAAGLPLLLLLVSTSADWTWAFPGLAVPALGLAAAAAAPRGASALARRPRRALARWAPAALLAAAALAAAMPYVSERLSDRALTSWGANPQAALADLRGAARAQPLDAAPLLREGILALELGRPGPARDGFAGAAARDRTAWFPRYELALLQPRARRARALALLDRARALNPREPAIAAARRSLAAGRHLDPLTALRDVLEEQR